MPPNSFSNIAFISSGTEEADRETQNLRQLYGTVSLDRADVVVALGGDGLMLETLHKIMERPVPVYGMNFGSVGFMMNEFSTQNLLERLHNANPTAIHPLSMQVELSDGTRRSALALNEVSLFRASHQAAKIEIAIDKKVRLSELVCDGVLIATPAGSTAYNLSAHGPILPIDAPLLALTPISPFRPRRWRGAILPNRASVTFTTREAEKRPVNAVADNVEFRAVRTVNIQQSTSHGVTLLFDPGHSLEERVLNEQFLY